MSCGWVYERELHDRYISFKICCLSHIKHLYRYSDANMVNVTFYRITMSHMLNDAHEALFSRCRVKILSFFAVDCDAKKSDGNFKYIKRNPF